jgi:putative spermidine/putrescine transport system substrate-binding protein
MRIAYDPAFQKEVEMTDATGLKPGAMGDRVAKTGLAMTRRGLLKVAGATLMTGVLSAPFIRPSYAARSIRISTFGGFFEETFREHVYPAFTKATGIAVQSIPQAEGAQFLIQLAAANRAGAPPMDICCAGQSDVLRGRARKLWRSFDPKSLSNLDALAPGYVFSDDAGVDGVGAMAWYITFVCNTKEVTPLPTSWSTLWEKASHPIWGVGASGESAAFDIAAHLYFGGGDILNSKEGIDMVLAKIAEIKPNVKLWWTDEGTMQTALQNDQVAGGTYYHDVATTMIQSGTPVKSIFPKEGGVRGFNAWSQPSASTKVEEAKVFLDYNCSPEMQENIARYVGSAPVLPRRSLNLTDAEFAACSSDIPPIIMNAGARFKFEEYMQQKFTEMVSA